MKPKTKPKRKLSKERMAVKKRKPSVKKPGQKGYIPGYSGVGGKS